MPAQEMINTLSMVGFGMDTGSGLMGESSGMLPQRRRWSDIERANPQATEELFLSTRRLAAYWGKSYFARMFSKP